MISIAITTYNRTDLVIDSFSKVYNHPLVDEIVIVDDASESKYADPLERMLFKHPAREKMKLFRNLWNLGMSRNKAEAISKCKNDWVVILDSDNILYPEYLDAIAKENLNPLIIYCPEKAEPDHDFTTLPNRVIDKQNAKDFLRQVEFRVFLNTSNYLVNRDEYLRVYKYNPDIQEADTIWMNTNWLKAGNAFYIVPGMRYHHRKHDGSGWINGNHAKNMRDANNLQEEIRNL